MMKSLGEELVISPYYSWWSALHWDSSPHYPLVPSPCNWNSFVPASGVSMTAVMNHWHWHNDSQMNEDLNAHFRFHCLNPERQKKKHFKINISRLRLSVIAYSDTARCRHLAKQELTSILDGKFKQLRLVDKLLQLTSQHSLEIVQVLIYFSDTKQINKGLLIFVCPLKGHNCFSVAQTPRSPHCWSF